MRRQKYFIEELRNRIIQGVYTPGSRIPNRIEMVESLGGSTATIQRAFDRLEKEGFLVSKGRFGSFVSEKPPHLSRIALVHCLMYPGNLKSIYRQNIDNAAKKITRSGQYSVKIYEPLLPQPSSDDHSELVNDIRNHCLAGIIFAAEPPSGWKDSIMAESSEIPRVMIGAEPRFYKDLPSVKVETSSFFEMAVEDAIAHSRKKLALIMVDDDIAVHAGRFRRIVTAAGLETRPYWEQGTSWKNKINVTGLVRLMFNPGQKERPDAIIVSDDNLLEGVVQGLVDSGVSVPDEVRLICLVNRPILPDVSVEYSGIGINMENLMDKALGMLKSQRLGKNVKMSGKVDIEIGVINGRQQDSR